jgi:hypothetical protein
MFLLDTFEIALLQIDLALESADALPWDNQPAEEFQKADEA